MKKALIDQMFIGFLILSSVVIFIATLSDEKAAKNQAYNLDDLAIQSIRTLAGEYFRGMNGNLLTPTTSVTGAICQAENIANQLLNATELGQELLDSNEIQYVWKDAGTYNATTDTYDNLPDGRPDSITAIISEQQNNTFWYRLLDKNTFKIPSFARAVDVNRFQYNVNVSFRGVIEAGYYNMVGTYEEDDLGCPKNAKLILADKNAWASKIGQNLDTIEMPKTKMFFIADGYRRFGNYDKTMDDDAIGKNPNITTDSDISFDCSGTYPTAIIETNTGVIQRSDDGHDDLTSRANVYFKDTSLNFDKKIVSGEEVEADHINEIAEKDWGAFVAVMEKKGDWNQEATDYAATLNETEREILEDNSADYDQWEAYAAAKGIDFSYDPQGEYVFVSEDLAATTDTDNNILHDKWNSDNDFSDMSFSMRKIFVPEPVDLSLISSDSVMNISCP